MKDLILETKPGDMGIVIGDLSTLLVQEFHDVQGRRLPDIVRIFLIGNAQYENFGSLHAFTLTVESLNHLLHDKARHLPVDLISHFDQSRLVCQKLQLPRKVMRIHWDAVAAQSRTGIERHENKKNRGGGAHKQTPNPPHPPNNTK